MVKIRLDEFIVAAKAATYAGEGSPVPSCRPGSHDFAHSQGPWSYLDSYFGGTDFAGQETVWYKNKPVWAMNYYGTIMDPSRLDAQRAGTVIKAALSALYQRERRFLGGWTYDHEFGRYTDQSQGTFERFTGREAIHVDDLSAFQLHYHGGKITA